MPDSESFFFGSVFNTIHLHILLKNRVQLKVNPFLLIDWYYSFYQTGHNKWKTNAVLSPIANDCVSSLPNRVQFSRAAAILGLPTSYSKTTNYKAEADRLVDWCDVRDYDPGSTGDRK